MAQCPHVARGITLLLALALAAASLGGLLRFDSFSAGPLIERGYQALYSSGPGGAAGALAAFREALKRDPANPDRWADLALALEQYGRGGEAQFCYARSLELAPNSPQMWLRAANFSFSNGDYMSALTRYSNVLGLTPAYDDVVFSYLELMELPLAQVLSHGLPPNPKTVQAYFRYLLARGEFADADRMWTWAAERSFTDDRLAADYADSLLGRKRFEDAASVWRSHFAARAPQYRVSEYIFNGGFEFDPTPGAFDWRLSPPSGVQTGFDQNVARSGRRSLRLTFTGTANVAFCGVAQRAAVQPGVYRLRADVRTDGLSTDRGIFLRVYDAESPARLDVQTAELTGGHDWRTVEARLHVTLPTRLLEIRVHRTPSLKFDNKIRGTLWLDNVTLQKAAEAMR